MICSRNLRNLINPHFRQFPPTPDNLFVGASFTRDSFNPVNPHFRQFSTDSRCSHLIGRCGFLTALMLLQENRGRFMLRRSSMRRSCFIFQIQDGSLSQLDFRRLSEFHELSNVGSVVCQRCETPVTDGVPNPTH